MSPQERKSTAIVELLQAERLLQSALINMGKASTNVVGSKSYTVISRFLGHLQHCKQDFQSTVVSNLPTEE